MFSFIFIGKQYNVSLETGEPEVTPFDTGVQAHVLDVYEETTKGQYYPHPNDREKALSDALDGDFNPEPYDPADIPKGAEA